MENIIVEFILKKHNSYFLYELYFRTDFFFPCKIDKVKTYDNNLIILQTNL
jgi:hypothetical protein